jgi:O-antigen/teichoic acid export membrane protein
MNPSPLQQLGREFLWVGLGQATAALGAIVGVRLITHCLTPTAYGELALGMTIATLSQQILLAPLSGASLRFFAPAQEAGQISSYISAVGYLLTRAVGLALVALAVLSVGIWVSGHAGWLGLVFGSFGFALLAGTSAVLDGMQNAARQRVVVAWHDGLAPWLRFFTAVVLIGLLGAFSSVAMLGYGLASVTVLFSQYLFFRRRISVMDTTRAVPTVAHEWTRQMYNYGWPFAVTGLFSWVHASSDRWALQFFSSTSTVGLYAVLYQMGYYPISLLANLITQLVMPVLFSRAGDGSDLARMQTVRKINRTIILCILGLTGLATLVAATLHAQIFALFVPSEYFRVSKLLPWVTLAGGVYASGQMAVLFILSSMKTKSLMFFRIGGGLLGITLNFLGAWIWGINGIVLAILLWAVFYLFQMMRLWKDLSPKINYKANTLPVIDGL